MCGGILVDDETEATRGDWGRLGERDNTSFDVGLNWWCRDLNNQQLKMLTNYIYS